MEFHAFFRGWDHPKLAHELGVTMNTLNRLRFQRMRYLDPELLQSAMEVFDKQPNELLLPIPECESRYADVC